MRPPTEARARARTVHTARDWMARASSAAGMTSQGVLPLRLLIRIAECQGQPAGGILLLIQARPSAVGGWLPP